GSLGQVALIAVAWIGAMTLAPQHATPSRRLLSLFPRLLIEQPQRLHNVVKADCMACRRVPQRRRRLDRARIRGPRGEDRPFLVEREIGIVDDMGWMLECLRGVQELVELADTMRTIRIESCLVVELALHGPSS